MELIIQTNNNKILKQNIYNQKKNLMNFKKIANKNNYN